MELGKCGIRQRQVKPNGQCKLDILINVASQIGRTYGPTNEQRCREKRMPKRVGRNQLEITGECIRERLVNPR